MSAQLIGAERPVKDTAQYMVVFKTGEGIDAKQKREEHLGRLKVTATNKFDIGTLVGYSAVLSPETLEIVLADPDVKYVEKDQAVQV